MIDPKVSYRIALLRESMAISGEFLLIRLHLKNPTSKEIIALEERADRIQKLIQESRS